MRNISFSFTLDQFLDGSKTVTRRLGWAELTKGDRLMACEKCQGIARGGLVRLGVLEVLHVRREALAAITEAEVRREGFPEMSPAGFVAMFCEKMKCTPAQEVTRIEFRRLDP